MNFLFVHSTWVAAPLAAVAIIVPTLANSASASTPPEPQNSSMINVSSSVLVPDNLNPNPNPLLFPTEQVPISQKSI